MQWSILSVALLGMAVASVSCGQGATQTPAGTTATTPAADALAPGMNIGMWVWHREEVVDAEERARLIEFCRTYGISSIFVQVRFTPEAGGKLSLATPEAWRALLAAAREAGVNVEALDGGNAMGFAENRADTLAKLDAVLAFHREQPPGEGFAGIRYDIEPYTSARWRSGEVESVMREFLETASIMRERVRAADSALTISHDIPAFYDGQDRYDLEFAGVRKNFHQHIQDVADFIGVMSYRTHAAGPNSVSAISAAELAYGRELGRKVYLSLETVPLSDTPQITFHGRTPEEYRAVIAELASHLADEPAFGGLFLHQYRTIRTLLEGGAPPPRP